MDDKGIEKKNFRRWGTSIQEISAQQVMLGTIALIPFGRSNSYEKNCSRDIEALTAGTMTALGRKKAELVAGYAAMTEFLPPQARGRWGGILNGAVVLW